MSKMYKIIISIAAILCSAFAAAIGYGLVGSSDLLFPQRFLCNFIFIMQFLTTMWCVIALFRKTKEK